MTVTVSDSGILFNDGSLQPTALTTGTQTIAGAKTFSSNVTLTAGVQGALVLATAQATTSGTAINFTGIPSWARRITVSLNGVSLSGGAYLLIQIGKSGGLETTGYNSAGAQCGASPAGGTSTSGFLVFGWSSTYNCGGQFVLTLVDAASNTWAGSGMTGSSAGGYLFMGAGNKSLAGTLDRLTLTTTNGTDTFDAGSVNIMYEG